MAAVGVIPELDAILEPLKSSAFKDKEGPYQGYRNHCQRMANITLLNFGSMSAVTPRARKLVAVAAAFHDIAIWTHGTWDYLAPSEGDASDWMKTQGKNEFPPGDIALVVRMIEEHHKFWPIKCDNEGNALTECFRRGDWCDVSFGWFLWAVKAQQYRELKVLFPPEGFFEMLLRVCWDSWYQHPFSNPMPMMKW